MRKVAFPVVIALLVVGGLALVVQSSTTGGVYDMTIKELLDRSDDKVGKEIRVNGVIQQKSFKDLSGKDGLDFRFTIGDSEGNRIRVRFHQLLPDAFQEGRQVIVQGKLLSKDEIECYRLTVKCPSKYKDENKTDADMWKGYDVGSHKAKPASSPE